MIYYSYPRLSVRANDAWPMAEGERCWRLSTSCDRVEILARPVAGTGPGEVPGPALEGSKQVSLAFVALSPKARKQAFQPKSRC